MFEAAAESTLAGLIFTFVWALNDKKDTKWVTGVCELFERGEARVSFVELATELDVRLERAGTPFQLEQKASLRDVEAARARISRDADRYHLNTDGGRSRSATCDSRSATSNPRRRHVSWITSASLLPSRTRIALPRPRTAVHSRPSRDRPKSTMSFTLRATTPHVAAAVHTLIASRHEGARTLLEVGVGTGLFLEKFAQHYEVEGVDIPTDMLGFAHQRLPGVEFHVGDMREFKLDRAFDAVVCPFSSIGYMVSADYLRQAVVNMTAHLNSGGVLVFDGWLRPELIRGDYVASHTFETDGVVVTRMMRTVYQPEQARTQLDIHHLVGRSRELIEHYVERHDMGAFSNQEYVAVAEAAVLEHAEVVEGSAGGPAP